MKQTIEKYCEQHGISTETLIDVYQQGLEVKEYRLMDTSGNTSLPTK